MIRIYRKIDVGVVPRIGEKPPILIIELGKWWAIEFTRKFQEEVAYLRKGGSLRDYLKGHKSFTRVVKEGGIIPRWYGFAYHDFNRDVKVFMPVPINLIVVGWRWFRWTIVRRLKIEWPRFLWHHEREIYNLGLKNGYTMGKYGREARAEFYKIMTGTKDTSVS